MPLSTDGRPDRRTAFATLHAALDAGIRHIDTADAYGRDARETGHNERLVAAALAAWSGPRDEVVVATKGGHIRDAAGGWHTDGRAEWIRTAAHASRRRLGVERIGLYYFHRPDPAVSFMESVGALARLVEESVVAAVGLSNVDVAQLEAAANVIEVGAVQNELSP
jgi:aryl-alcohol dehydrogenase-like predicted oxidoreductase